MLSYCLCPFVSVLRITFKLLVLINFYRVCLPGKVLPIHFWRTALLDKSICGLWIFCFTSLIFLPILRWHSRFLLKSLLIVVEKFPCVCNWLFSCCFQNSFCHCCVRILLYNLFFWGGHLSIFNLLGILWVLWV